MLAPNSRDGSQVPEVSACEVADGRASAAVAREQWPPLKPLPTSNVPPFPVDALPPVLRAWVAMQSASTQVPSDLPALAGLSAVSAATAKAFVVAEPWFEPLTLWSATVLAAGSRASAVVTAAIAPLAEVEREMRGLAEARLRVSEVDRLVLRRRLSTALGAVADAETEDDRFLKGAEVADLQGRLASIDARHLPRLLSDDASPQSVVSLLGESHGRLAIMTSEDGPFSRLASLAKRAGPDLGNLLKAHSGEDIVVDRIGRAPVHVYAPSLVMGLRLHPHLLEAVRDHAGLRGTGVLARFLFAVPDSLVGYRDVEPPRCDPQVQREYVALVKGLVERSERSLRDEKQSVALRLDADAARAFLSVRRDIELRLRPNGDLAAIGEWAGKATGLVLRVAGLLHISARPVDTPTEITAATLLSAVGIVVGYGVPHARAVLLGDAASEALEQARRVADWLAATGRERVTQRDVHRKFQAAFEGAAGVKAALRVLEEHGFLRRLPPAPRPRGGWSSPAFEVNPRPAE
jgi:replicative DNA helicase